MAITVDVEMSNNMKEQVRRVVRAEYSRLSGTAVCVHCGVKPTSPVTQFLCITCYAKGLR